MEDRIDYYELFGLEDTDDGDEGGKKQEIAEPDSAPEEGIEGVKERQGAEAANDIEISQNNDSDDKNDNIDENARFAKVRRAAKEDAEKKMEKYLSQIGITKSDGTPIKTLDELKKEAYEKRAKEARDEEFDLREKLEYGGFDENEINELISAKNAKQELDALKQQIKRHDFDKKVEEELSIIAQYEPSVKSVEDLTRLDRFDEFSRHVNNGDNFLSAYLRTYKERIAQNSLPEYKNEPASKSHLSAHRAKSGAAEDLPDDIFNEYRRFNPHVSRAEAARHYQKNKNL